MNAIEKLFDEHRLIERVIDAMEAFTATVQVEAEPSRCELMRLVTFFREFADLIHHEKEEEFLMPALSEAGVRWDDGIMLQIRKDHEFERYLLQTLRHLALQTGQWSTEDCRRVIDVSTRFVQYMRGHIAREDHQLLPIVRERLVGAALEAVDQRMQRFDAKRESTGEIRLLLELADDLSARCATSKALRQVSGELIPVQQ
ncbi:MAG TPA: hemerythrin domain-containing protein [Polyangiaceae bacterium]